MQDSDLEREVRKQEDRKGGAALQRWRWFYVILIGITVALLSMVVNLGIAGLNSVKIKTTERLITKSGAHLCITAILNCAGSPRSDLKEAVRLMLRFFPCMPTIMTLLLVQGYLLACPLGLSMARR